MKTAKAEREAIERVSITTIPFTFNVTRGVRMVDESTFNRVASIPREALINRLLYLVEYYEPSAPKTALVEQYITCRIGTFEIKHKQNKS